MDKETRLAELLQDEAFGAACKNVESVEQLQALFAQNGVSLTHEEVVALCEQFGAQHDSELDADALDNVTGGVMLPRRPVLPTPDMRKVARKLWKILFR